jgi:hypothetical protein
MSPEPDRGVQRDHESTLFPEYWLPDKATAYQAPERAGRYAVHLVCWGESARNFEEAIPWIQAVSIPGWIEAWDWVASASVSWDDAEKRIVMEFLCEEEQLGFPDSTAEIMAIYVEREISVTVEDYDESGKTAILRVFVPD